MSVPKYMKDFGKRLTPADRLKIRPVAFHTCSRWQWPHGIYSSNLIFSCVSFSAAHTLSSLLPLLALETPWTAGPELVPSPSLHLKPPPLTGLLRESSRRFFSKAMADFDLPRDAPHASASYKQRRQGSFCCHRQFLQMLQRPLVVAETGAMAWCKLQGESEVPCWNWQDDVLQSSYQELETYAAGAAQTDHVTQMLEPAFSFAGTVTDFCCKPCTISSRKASSDSGKSFNLHEGKVSTRGRKLQP